MTWLDEYQSLSEKDKNLFRECANKLLSQTFLVAQNEKDKAYFRFCKHNIHLFKEYFFISGWELKITGHRENVIALSNKYNENRLTLSLSQSLLLFILAHDYQEKSHDISLLDKVVISNQEIREKYMALNISKRLPSLDEMVKTLKLFQKHSLIDLISGDWSSENAAFQIFDSIMICLSIEAINQISKWIEENDSEAAEEEDDEELDKNEDDSVALS
jgi:hypothetical protein